MAGGLAASLGVGISLIAHLTTVARAPDLAVQITYASSPLALLIGGWLGARHARRDMWRAPAPWAAVIGGGVVAGLAVKLLTEVVAVWEQAVTGPISGNNPVTLYPHAFSGIGPRLVLAVAVVAVAPAGEETFFRGLLYGRLRRRWGVGPASIVAGLLFGLAHADPWPVQSVLASLPLALPLAMVGVAFCLLYERYRTLWLTASAHAAFNATSLVAVFWGH